MSPTPMEEFFDEFRRLTGESRQGWTKEYPTQPGFYWIRNYHIDKPHHFGASPPEPVAEPVVVRVAPNHHNAPEFRLVFDFTGDDEGYGQRDIVSAEWWGPIEAPE